jgi:hypothetical protein
VKERVLWANNMIQASSSWGAQIMSESAAGGVRQMYFYKNTFQGSAATGFRFHPNYPNGSIQNVTLDSNTITGNTYGLTGGDWTPNACLDKLSVFSNAIIGNSLAAFSGSMGAMPPDAYYGIDLRWEGNTVTGNGNNNQQTSKGTFLAQRNRPSVSIVAPSLAILGQPVQFSLSYTAGASPLGNVLWDLGDGLPNTTSSTSFTYLNPGVYRIGLVIWDTSGRAAHDERSLSILPSVPGDFDRDQDVDQDDYGHLQRCLTGYWVSPIDPACQDTDLDGNGWVDRSDILVFQKCMTGPNVTGDPNCAK